jgi:predicted kinase
VATTTDPALGDTPALICLAGLPATGKTTVARELARALGAVHLRIDTIEQALLRADRSDRPVGALGYAVAYALAADHLRLGLTVVADSVNPVTVTRRAWREVALSAGAEHLDVEVICSDRTEHERRAAGRTSDIAGHTVPTWTEIVGRDYDAWDGPRLVVDTAIATVPESVATIVAHHAARR